ncbi:tRNA pseudouridine(13) synthase TruD [Pendulispora rubella]|uniref:tRNA pseudouridine synthase D n=1 Tax=Pendulispora rubella TaxID=2741070 RepID=A0ABZ2LGR6_9BACT
MARIKVLPEDFIVEEIPLYEPSGTGEHLYIRFTKREMTTDAAVDVIARAVGVRSRDVGVAGMKDRMAITTQTISVPHAPERDTRAMALVHERINVLETKRHTNKLRTGHLRANKFSIRIREVGDVDAAIAAFERIGREGVPNAFGAQRFGREGDNAERTRAWLTGKAPAPRDPRLKRLLFSALQSAVYNEVLERRVRNGTWNTCLEGDLAKRHDSGGLFLCTDVQEDRARAERGEISATGPLPGAKMREPEGEPRELEQQVVREFLGDDIDLTKLVPLGEGTRRPLRLWVSDLRLERGLSDNGREEEDSIRVYFVLPKGAYATTVISAAIPLDAEVGKVTEHLPGNGEPFTCEDGAIEAHGQQRDH